MAKRHGLVAGNWESVFRRLEELVLGNSGEDEFEEIFKLLVAKLLAEMHGEDAFRVHATVTETANAVNGLLAQAAERWKGIVPGPGRSRLTDEHLAVCVEALEELSLLDTTLEALDGVFEYLVSRSSKGSKGQYFTPRHVVDCCVKIVDPQPRETIIDPACGSGGFLIHALEHVRSLEPALDLQRYAERNLWGCDFDGRAVQVAKALMLIAGDGNSNIFRLNSLLTPEMDDTLFSLAGPDDAPAPRLTIEDVVRPKIRAFRGFDVILTNPPFAGEVREEPLLRAYELHRPGRRVERDVLFLERCVGLLRPGGRIGIVLPHNKLGSASWSYVREWLVKQLHVVAVLGLGRNTFLPHTHQKAAVLFGRKRNRPTRDWSADEVLFVVSDREGKDSKGQPIFRPGHGDQEPMWSRVDHDLGEAVSHFQSHVESNGLGWSD